MKFNLIDGLNRGTRKFDYELTDRHVYKKLEELYKENKDGVYIVRMFYTNKKSLYGENEVVVTDDYIINLPKHLTETVEKIVNNEEYLKLINEGKFAFNIYEYEYKQGKEVKKGYSVNWGIIH
jgi:hypothetical protein